MLHASLWSPKSSPFSFLWSSRSTDPIFSYMNQLAPCSQSWYPKVTHSKFPAIRAVNSHPVTAQKNLLAPQPRDHCVVSDHIFSILFFSSLCNRQLKMTFLKWHRLQQTGQIIYITYIIHTYSYTHTHIRISRCMFTCFRLSPEFFLEFSFYLNKAISHIWQFNLFLTVFVSCLWSNSLLTKNLKKLWWRIIAFSKLSNTSVSSLSPK